MTDFKSLGLTQSLLHTLGSLDFTTPTPIQLQAIPVVLKGGDVMGLAQTGTGKTGAFGLPIIDRLLRDPMLAKPQQVRSLILAPTRELATQIATNLRGFAKRSPLKIGLIVGGQSYGVQEKKLAKGTDILIATPGRLLDHLKRGSMSLDQVTYLVLDEADQMLDLGFIRDLRRIARAVPEKRQTLMFSATMPRAIADLSKAFLKDPVRIEVTPQGKAADKVEQSLYLVARGDKPKRLRAILSSLKQPHAMVFTRTKHGANKLQRELGRFGYSAAAIHGNKSQGQRTRALRAFKDGQIHILVATDVAARGIDIPGVTHVFNYDLPEVPEVYVHRIGRTARAGASGAAIAFCSPEENKFLRDIERLLKFKIERVDKSVGDGTAQAHDWFADRRPVEEPTAAPEKSGRKNPRPRRRPKTSGNAQSAEQGKRGESAQAHKPGSRTRSKPRKAMRGRRPNRARSAA